LHGVAQGKHSDAVWRNGGEPAGLACVEKRQTSAVKGHWQVAVAERQVSGGAVSRDQQGLLRTMMAFWKD